MQQYYNKISEQKRIAFVDNLTDEQALEISENYPFAVCFANADIDPENGKFPVIWLNGQRYGFSSINQNTTKINDVNLSLYIDENGILGLTAENNDFNITPNTSQTITESYLDVKAIIPNHDYSKLTWTLSRNWGTSGKTFKFNNSNGDTISEVQSIRVIPNDTSKPAAKSGSINLVINNGTQSTANGKITLESTFTQDESINENTYSADLKATYESLTPKQIRITYKNSTPGLTVGNWAWNNIPNLPEGITYEINNIDKKSTITFTNNTTSDYTINGGIIKVSNTNANPNEISVDEFIIPGKLINSVDISWNGADLGTINGIELGTINTTNDLLNAIKVLAQAIGNTYQLTLSATSGSITRHKGSLSSIAAVGGSDNITVTVGSTANITAPTSLTLTYGANTNNTATTPTATYNGESVTPQWTSNNESVAEVNGTTITAKAAGSTTLTASYNGKTATYNLTVTNESISSSVTSGWTYISDSTNIATISGTTVTGVAQGTTNIKVNYSGKTCNLTGTVTVNAVAPQVTYYWYIGTTKPTSLSQATTVTSYPAEQTYTNPSTTEKNYFHVLTNADKTVNFYDPSDLSTPSTKTEDITAIPGCKITSMTVRVAKGGTQVIKIS